MADPVADAAIMAAAAVGAGGAGGRRPGRRPPTTRSTTARWARSSAPSPRTPRPTRSGVLGTLLASVGAAMGNLRYIYQGSAQAPNLFVVLVGDSSTGRKGTAGSIAREVMNRAYPDWSQLIVAGLGSGEGLVGYLKANEKQGEHRALVMESEFGRLLTVMGREGSTLSPMVRDAWDGVPMGRILAREQSIVHSHHVGIVAHVTPVELRAKLSGTDAANGFGNRFIWLAVRRTRLVPFPTSPVEHVDQALFAAVGAAIAEAQTPGEVPWSPDARDAWEDLYLELSMQRPLRAAGRDDGADRGADRPPGARVRAARPVARHRRPAPSRRARPVGLRGALGRHVFGDLDRRPPRRRAPGAARRRAAQVGGREAGARRPERRRARGRGRAPRVPRHRRAGQDAGRRLEAAGDGAPAGRNNHNNHDNRAGARAGEGGLRLHGSCAVYVVIGLARPRRGLRATPVWFSRFSRLFAHLMAEPPRRPPDRSDRRRAGVRDP